jgi:hypothetical protein
LVPTGFSFLVHQQLGLICRQTQVLDSLLHEGLVRLAIAPVLDDLVLFAFSELVPEATEHLQHGLLRSIALQALISVFLKIEDISLGKVRDAGEIVRALAWAGPERVDEVLKEIENKVPRTDLQKVSQHISLFPGWLAAALSRSATYA